MIVHLNGELVPLEQARISPLDRGWLFGDGVYEGLRAFDGRVFAMDRHIGRLRDGLASCRIAWDAAMLTPLSERLLEANGLGDAFLYWQVTRGTPRAGQPVRARLPAPGMQPTVFGYCLPTPRLGAYPPIPTKSAAVVEDLRWRRGLIKSTSLLGNVLATIDADEAGAEDAILVRDGLVAEATSANVLLALPRPGGGPELVTPDLDSVSILAGVTRAVLLDSDLGIVERPVSVEELHQASEIMILGTLSMVTSITRLDGRAVGDGAAGPAAGRVMERLLALIATESQPAAGSGSDTALRCSAHRDS